MNFVIISDPERPLVKTEGVNTTGHLIKINGEFLIERMIRLARDNGAKAIFCIINMQEKELKEYLSSNDFGLPVNLIKSTISAMYSLHTLASLLDKEQFCLATPDLIFDEIEFTDFINYATLQEETGGTVAVTRCINNENPVCVSMDEDDNILKFSDSKEGYNWANGGLYSFSPKIFNEIQYALSDGCGTLRNFLQLLIAQGYRLKGFSFLKIIKIEQSPDVEKARKLINL